MGKAVYLVILTVLLCASSLSATTYYVDDCNGNDNWDGTSPVYVSGNIGPVKTISEGLHCRDRGDIVIVSDGIYRGEENLQLQFYYDNVTLKSAKGPDKCILNFSENDYHWDFGCNANLLISGFTFRGIRGQTMYFNEENEIVIDNCIFENNILYNNSSLIQCGYQESLKLNNCIFRDNVFEYGSIIKAYGASLEVNNCQMTENASINDFPLILCESDSNVLIADTLIDDNWNYNEQSIQGIYCSDTANVKITGCTISGNYSYGDFSGVYSEAAANVTIAGCTISNNWSKKGTSAVYVGYPSTVDIKIIDCIISNNTVYQSDGNCGISVSRANSSEIKNCLISGNNGGIASYGDNQSTILNCTIVNNKNTYGGCYVIVGRSKVVNCIIKDNSNNPYIGNDIIVSYSDISDNTDHIWPGIGNLNTEPLFADPNNGDYHLLSQAGRWEPDLQQWVRDDVSSPCIDAGDPTEWVGDEPAGSGGRINMGYFGGTAQASKADFCNGSLPGDANRDCLVNFVDFALMTSNWLDSTIEQP